MPIVRKIINVGKTSKGVILPKSWLEYYEREQGKTIENVAIEVNKVLVVKPIFNQEKKHAVEGQGQVDPSTEQQTRTRRPVATNEKVQ